MPERKRRILVVEDDPRVREITVGADGMANGVVYYDGGGVEQFQPAEVVVLASNGMLVERAVEIIERMGARILDPGAARAKLGLN